MLNAQLSSQDLLVLGGVTLVALLVLYRTFFRRKNGCGHCQSCTSRCSSIMAAQKGRPLRPRAAPRNQIQPWQRITISKPLSPPEQH